MGEGDLWIRGLKILLKKGLTPEQIKSLSRNSLFSHLFSEGYSLQECFGLYNFISSLSLEEIRKLSKSS